MSVMKIFRRNKGFYVTCVLILILFLKCIHYYTHWNNVIRITTRINPTNNNNKYCPIPIYTDFVRDSKDTIFGNIKCPQKQDLVVLRNGKVIISKNQNCEFQCIYWKTDFNYRVTSKKILVNSTNAPCMYFYVTCNDNVTSKVDSQLIITGIRNETLIKESKLAFKGLKKPRDVLVLGIDSMSYNAYKHYLPKVYSVLHDELNGVSFTKFNTMGDGTTVNLQGLLTGTKDTETYESRRRIAGAKTVDKYNWIWNHYKKYGYLTQYYEEMTEYGTFQYRLLGFENQPTDVYLRTVLLFAEQKKISEKLCLGNKPQHQETLRFYKEISQTYQDIPTFSFVYFSLASHDDNKYSKYMDGDIAQFLVKLRQNNPDILIILYADHGHRFKSRLSMQGKYEERLPFLGISLPVDLVHLKPVLKRNSEILITGVDVHATLEDILGIYKPQIRNRHMSLLRKLPKDRSCSDVESAEHWCACLNFKEIHEPNHDKRLLSIASSVVGQISNFTFLDRDLCSELKIDTIVSMRKMEAKENLLKFKQSADVDGFIPDLSDETKQTEVWFQIVLKTKPGDAIFDVTVSVNSNHFDDKENDIKVNKINANDVSRINRYSPWIKCLTSVKNRYSVVSDIRKFCICKSAIF